VSDKKHFAVMPVGGTEPLFIEAASMAQSNDEFLVLTDEKLEVVYTAPWRDIGYCNQVSAEEAAEGRVHLKAKDEGARRMTDKESEQLYHELILAVFSRGDVPLDWLYEKKAAADAAEEAMRPKVEVVDVDIDWEATLRRILAMRFGPWTRTIAVSVLAAVAIAWGYTRLLTPHLYTRAVRELVHDVESRDAVADWKKRWERLVADAKDARPSVTRAKSTDTLMAGDLRVLLERARSVDEEDVNVSWLARWDKVFLARDEVFADAWEDRQPGGS